MKTLALVVLLAGGCAARAELRTQQCAHRCLDTFGAHRPAGAYGSEACGDRCNCTLWDGRAVYVRQLTSDQWP